MSRKREGLSRKVGTNEELRKNLNIIALEAEKVIEQVPAHSLTEFTNFLNVLRINDLENVAPNSLRNAVVKRAMTLFTEEKYRPEINELTFD